MSNENVNANGYEIGWDDEVENVPSFFRIEDGEYDFFVDHFERAKVSGDGKYAGQNMAVIYCNIDAPGEPQVKANIIMNTKFQWKISQFFISIGQMENKENAKLRPNWSMIGGSRGRCRIENKPNYNDATKTHPEITEFLPPAQNGKKWGSGF